MKMRQIYVNLSHEFEETVQSIYYNKLWRIMLSAYLLPLKFNHTYDSYFLKTLFNFFYLVCQLICRKNVQRNIIK